MSAYENALPNLLIALFGDFPSRLPRGIPEKGGQCLEQFMRPYFRMRSYGRGQKHRRRLMEIKPLGFPLVITGGHLNA